MNCKECRALFEEYLEGTLAPERAAAVREHLARCSSCRAEAELFGGLRESPPAGIEPPPAFRAGLEERIRRYEMLGPGGKEEVYLPDVRFYAGDDISFLRYTRYYLFKNYYRRKIFRVLGEYFPDRGAISLVAAVNALRARLEQEQGRKISFREGLKTWHATEYEIWRRDWEKAPEDSDLRFSTRLRHALGRLPSGIKILAAFAPFIFFFLLLVLPSGVKREIHLAHHLQGEQRVRLENALAAMGKKVGVRFRFTVMDEESLVFLSHHHGGYQLRVLKPDLLLMDVNLLAYLGRIHGFRGTGQHSGGLPAGFPPGVRPLFSERIAPEGLGRQDMRLASFPVFAAAMTGPDGRFPAMDTVKARLQQYRGLWRGKKDLAVPPLYRIYGLARLSELPQEARLLPERIELLFSGGKVAGFSAPDWSRRVLYDPQAYPGWRLTFPEYVLYGMLTGSGHPEIER